MPIKKLRPSFAFTEDRLAQLKAIVPEAFADGKINWEALKQALGEFLEDESPEAEHFGLFWPGKREARRLATLPSKGTLVPAAGEGVDEDKTRNIFIEGENLEVLKLLQKSYAGRIKMIYIDPPYNTGNDFVYKDDFKEPLEEYLKRTGQADENGKLLTTNTKTGGRFHSNWLSMMYPRLLLAKRLLRDDGAIFVSIDANESHNLRHLMNEVFGPENFVAQVVWQKVYSPRMDDQGISPEHDFVMIYSCSNDFVPARMNFEQNVSQFTGIDPETGQKYRPRSLRKEGKNSKREDRPNLFYAIEAPDGSKILPIRSDRTEGCWRMQIDTYKSLLAQGRIEWVRVKGHWQPYVKQFHNEKATRPYSTLWLHTEVGHNHEAVDEVKKLFGESVFDNPKPTRLVRRMLNVTSEFLGEPDIILDFFAGSATTAHAVLAQNFDDKGKRQFIMVQIPMPAQRPKYSSIAEIGKERIRRVIAKMKKERNGKSSSNRETPEDLGFKVFKLARSNFKAWQDYDGENIQELEKLFDQTETPLVKGWKEDDLLTEIMLQQGFPLDSKITRQSGFKSNKVKLIETEACAHRLFVCLDPRIKEDTIKHLELRIEDIFVCLDSALTDQAKMRLADVCNLKVI